MSKFNVLLASKKKKIKNLEKCDGYNMASKTKKRVKIKYKFLFFDHKLPVIQNLMIMKKYAFY